MLLLAAALAGCVPAPYGSYLRPSYPDPSSAVAKAACDGQAGPPSKLSFVAPGQLKVAVSAQRPARDRNRPVWLVSIDLTPPSDAGFRFLSDALHVAGGRDEPGDRIKPDVVARSSQRLPARTWIEIPRLGPTSQAAAQRALDDRPGSDVVEVSLGIGELPGTPRRIRVVLPTAQTAGQRFEVPVQELAADSDEPAAQTLRSPGYVAALAERETACHMQTPQLACENIPRYDPYSFRQESGPFTYLGRFWNFRGAKQEPLRFELQVQARTAQPWQIVDPVVRITDVASGETRAHAFDEMQVSVRYPAALDTHLRGHAPQMLITVPLARSRPRYFVQLPPYVVHGRRYEVKLIELEQRLFDAGLEPFNC
jgi:hypothetical protein